MVPGTQVTLDGSGSRDRDAGTTLTYEWSQTSGTTVTLSSATAIQPTFTAPNQAATLVFQLVVNDGVNSLPATVIIVVVPKDNTAPPTGNTDTQTDRPTGSGPGGGQPSTGLGSGSGSPSTGPLLLALWTERPGYRSGDQVRLYRTQDPRSDQGSYLAFFYLERAGGGERRYFAPGNESQELREQAVDHLGRPEGACCAERVERETKQLIWQGQAPEPGLWEFVAEFRPASEGAETRRARARFLVAERTQLLNRRNFNRSITDELTLRGNTIYYLLHQLFVRSGATLRIEAGALVLASGPTAAIIVEPGGRIEAEGTSDAPVVLTCSTAVGLRESGCWGGVRVLGRAPLTRLEGVAAGVAEADRAAYGGTDPHDSSGTLRYVRIEFAGADPGEGGSTAALGLYGVGDGTVLEHVQTHASLGDGIGFSGGTAACERCVASGSATAGLAWQRGWRGAARHLYVQHGPGDADGIAGANDAQGHDLEPRSRPELSNVTLARSSSDRLQGAGAGLRLGTGSAVVARDLLVTGFPAGAIQAGSRSALLFRSDESLVESAILYQNGCCSGNGQLRGGITDGVEFRDTDPQLRRARHEANPDPRPQSGSPALKPSDPDAESYIGAFGAENWLEGWTWFGPEADYDTR